MRKLAFLVSALLVPAVSLGAPLFSQNGSAKTEAATVGLPVVGGWYSQGPSVWYRANESATGTIAVSGNQLLVDAQLCSHANCRTINDTFNVVTINSDGSVLLSRGGGDKLFTLRSDEASTDGDEAVSILSERSTRSGYVLYVAAPAPAPSLTGSGGAGSK